MGDELRLTSFSKPIGVFKRRRQIR